MLCQKQNKRLRKRLKRNKAQIVLLRKNIKGKKRTLRTMKNKNIQASKNIGMAFAGGGFRAHSSHAGVLAGLMGKNANFQTFFTNVGHFCSNSGGSWFCGQLFHSATFKNLIDEIANAPTYTKAGKLYNDNYIDPIKKSFNNLPNVDISGIPPLTNFADLWAELKFVLSKNLSWSEFVKTFMTASTPDLDLNATLQHSQMPLWASGKTWSLMGGICTSMLRNSISYPIIIGKNSDGTVVFGVGRTSEGIDTPMFSPLAFHSTLSPKVENSPYPSCSKQTNSITIDYKLETTDSSRVIPGEKEGDLVSFANKDSNKVRILDALSTSSSAAAVLSISNGKPTNKQWITKIAQLTAHANVQDTDYISSFTNADKLLKNGSTDEVLAKAQVAVLADGGSVDGTGVAQLVANGTTEIVSIMDVAKGKIDQWEQLFTPTAPPKGFNPISVFAKSQEAAVSLFGTTMKELTMPKINLSKLQSIKYGTFTLMTKDSPSWGVVAGKTIILHVIQIESGLGMGGTNWGQYGPVVGQIRHTISQNPVAKKKYLSGSDFKY